MIKDLYNKYINHNNICTDTRLITEGCLFFALKGNNFNGNKFAKQAIEKGAAYVIIDEVEFKQSKKFILVDDVLTTLQLLANHHRKQLNIPFIGITGTNGKTTTKELLFSVLNTTFKTSATKGNLNNHIGVPLTILAIPQDSEVVIIEMGANHIGEIKYLCNIAEPDYGIITNIGTAHIEGFGSKAGVIKTKNELYQFIKEKSGKIFVNANDELLINLSTEIDTTTYGTSSADCIAQLISSTPTVQIKWKDKDINSQLYGNYNFENILTAICIGEFFKVSDDNIVKAIESYISKNNRSEILNIDNNTYYLDAYNANPSSMNAAIDTFVDNNAINKLMVLGDMLELGKISTEEHQQIVDKSKTLGLNAIFVGREFKNVKDKYQFEFVNDNNEAKLLLETKHLINYHILIKGSRGVQLEKIIKP